jgi:putative restriction endonuclease
MSMSAANFELDVRKGAFAWLEEQVTLDGESLHYRVLADGFDFKGNQIRLISQQGIFKPAALSFPLSITTAAAGPYEDQLGSDGVLRYKYRGTDPMHRDNVGLRECRARNLPLVYLHGIGNARYVPVWPVFVVGDLSHELSFLVSVDDVIALRALETLPAVASVSTPEAEIRRGYITVLAKRRIHQQAFRERVLEAYRQQCALCRLKHEVLLDAAHIIADSEAEGVPEVKNGLALCKIHHAAFDKHFLTVRPDYQIEIRADLLNETDGPMLKHGLQGLHHQEILLPRDAAKRPDRGFLEHRYQRFIEYGRR